MEDPRTPPASGRSDLNLLLKMGTLIESSALGRSSTGDDEADIARFLAERILAVRGRNGSTTPLRPNRAQLLFDQRKGRRNIILKARQMGITTWIAGRFLLKTMTRPGTLTVQVAHTREAAENIFGIAQRMWEHLPVEWREGPLARTRSSAGRMVFGALDSEFRVISAGEENAGRGLTIQNLHVSELSRWPGDAQATLAGLRAALVPTGEITIESTPAGAQGAFYEAWHDAEENGFVQHFFPWWLEPEYTAAPALDLTGEELELAQRHQLSPEQIGYRRQLSRSFRELRAQEFAEDAASCFRASGACCFPVDEIERRMQDAPAPQRLRRDGALQVWLPPALDHVYILGIDAAGGGSEGDYAAIQLIDCETGLQCLELRERINPYELADIAIRLAREYNGAIIAVERNNHGHTVIAHLTTSMPYANLYEGPDGQTGIFTNAANKPIMVSRIGAILEEHSNFFSSQRLLEECRTFLNHANGSAKAAAGCHDDLVMAMAIAQAARAAILSRPIRQKQTSAP